MKILGIVVALIGCLLLYSTTEMPVDQEGGGTILLVSFLCIVAGLVMVLKKKTMKSLCSKCVKKRAEVEFQGQKYCKKCLAEVKNSNN